MKKFKNAHLWLTIALAVVLLGFVRSYWSQLPDVAFDHTLHLLSATAWFALLVWQPRLATTGRLDQHRRNGMIGLFLAGLVVGTALLMMPANIENGQTRPEGGFVDPTFFYGITFFDMVTIFGFSFSVIMAMLKSKDSESHALWMISTVFWIVGPAFARIMAVVVIGIRGIEGLNFLDVIAMAQPIILAAMVITAWRLKTRHPALVLAFLGNLSFYLARTMGESLAWRAFCDTVLL